MVSFPLLASVGRYQVSKGCQRLLSLLKGYLVTACKSDNGSISLSTLMALKDIAAMAAAIPPVLHQRDFQVCQRPLLKAPLLLQVQDSHQHPCPSPVPESSEKAIKTLRSPDSDLQG